MLYPLLLHQNLQLSFLRLVIALPSVIISGYRNGAFRAPVRSAFRCGVLICGIVWLEAHRLVTNRFQQRTLFDSAVDYGMLTVCSFNQRRIEAIAGRISRRQTQVWVGLLASPVQSTRIVDRMCVSVHTSQRKDRLKL